MFCIKIRDTKAEAEADKKLLESVCIPAVIEPWNGGVGWAVSVSKQIIKEASRYLKGNK